jgi:SAM-dependent methyltransferase
VQQSRGEPAALTERQQWNARYEAGRGPLFIPHPLAERALSMPLPDGPVADLACGPSGAALLAASMGRRVTAVDVSEVALRLLGQEAERRGTGDLVTLVHADLRAWRPPPGRYALVLCTGYWDRAVFPPAAEAVAPGGLLAWEAFTAGARRTRPRLPAAWCLAPGEPASLLTAGFEVIEQRDMPDASPAAKRSLLARRRLAQEEAAARPA